MVRKRVEGGISEKTFSERVVEIARAIPKGRVMTYGLIARYAGGGAMAAQSVTSILGRAYDNGTRDIPFHRIVYADGRIWASDGRERRERMRKYRAEGIELDARDRIVDFADVLFDPNQSSKWT